MNDAVASGVSVTLTSPSGQVHLVSANTVTGVILPIPGGTTPQLLGPIVWGTDRMWLLEVGPTVASARDRGQRAWRLEDQGLASGRRSQGRCLRRTDGSEHGRDDRCQAIEFCRPDLGANPLGRGEFARASTENSITPGHSSHASARSTGSPPHMTPLFMLLAAIFFWMGASRLIRRPAPRATIQRRLAWVRTMCCPAMSLTLCRVCLPEARGVAACFA